MNTTPTCLTPSVRAPLAQCALPLLLLTCGIGCAADHAAELRLTSTETNAAFRQQFEKAYVSKGAEGNTEIVLVNDADAPAAHHAGGTLQPAAVRQVMHVKVLWRPQRGTKQSHPSYTNAGIHWYVYDAPGDGGGPSDVLEYTGAGFVALADTPAGTQVTIRNASIKPVGTANGTLSDPVGPARLTGTFLAKKSSKRVSDLLAEVKDATNDVRAEQASAR